MCGGLQGERILRCAQNDGEWFRVFSVILRSLRRRIRTPNPSATAYAVPPSPKEKAILPSPWGRSAPALPVADKAGVLRVQRSVCNAGVRAKAHTGNRKRKGDREAVDEVLTWMVFAEGWEMMLRCTALTRHFVPPSPKGRAFLRPKGRAFLPSPWGRSAPALPVADKAGVLRVQRSVCNAGVRAKAHTGNRKRKGDREAVDEGGRALRHMNDPGRRTARYDLIRPSVRTGAPSPKEKAILPSPLGKGDREAVDEVLTWMVFAEGWEMMLRCTALTRHFVPPSPKGRAFLRRKEKAFCFLNGKEFCSLTEG